MLNFETVRTLVRGILEQAMERPDEATNTRWSIQGFGMLRVHLPGDYRLNVWDSRHRVKDVSLIHDHPWHFESLVVSGRLVNRRFTTMPMTHSRGDLVEWAKLKPGPGGGLLGRIASGRERSDGGVVKLVAHEPEVYRAGDTYQQARDEVHRSDPEDGCVTFNRRHERLAVDEARVFWPAGSSWVSAEPRLATREEVKAVVGRALAGWDR